jgi:glutamine amidotransferase
MNKNVTVVDYGLGNIFSLVQALEHLGSKVHLTCNPEDIIKAECVILPGVGAFENGIRGLSKHRLVQAIKDYAKSNKPMMGICLGMQMLFSKSYEFGEHQGLGIIEGTIESIESHLDTSQSLKVPHIGWNKLQQDDKEQDWANSIMKYIEPESFFYHVHSFMAVPKNPQDVLAKVTYGNVIIPAVVKRSNIYGCQFHPEKSGTAGLKMLRGFLEIEY